MFSREAIPKRSSSLTRHTGPLHSAMKVTRRSRAVRQWRPSGRGVCRATVLPPARPRASPSA
jgi:hypothetical protein